jgi:hypothetical protein
MIRNSSDEYQKEVLSCALALKTLRQSEFVTALSLKTDDNEFGKDLSKAYDAIVGAGEKSKEKKETKETKEKDPSELKVEEKVELLADAIVIMMEKIAVAEANIKKLQKARR